MLLNQTINFEQSTFRLAQEGSEHRISDIFREHRDAVAEKIEDLKSELKKFDLLHVSSSSDQTVKQRASELLHALENLDEIGRFNFNLSYVE